MDSERQNMNGPSRQRIAKGVDGKFVEAYLCVYRGHGFTMNAIADHLNFHYPMISRIIGVAE